LLLILILKSFAKVKQSIAFACEGVNVNPLELESRIDYFLKDGIKTSDIQLNIIEHAKQLATAENPEWLLVAGHAFAMHEVHNNRLFTHDSKDKGFYNAVKTIARKGYYVDTLLKDFSKEDIESLGEYIDYGRDLDYSYAALVTNKDKYQNPYELNQHVHMVNAMRFAKTVKDHKVEYAKEVYDVLGVVPEFISTYNSRKFAFPHLVQSNDKGKHVLFGGMPKDIDKKVIIWELVAKREPQITWQYTKNNTLKKENYDQTDAYCAALGYMKMKEIW
jgi:ribonucleoside-diphosphate reductase alpha chain